MLELNKIYNMDCVDGMKQLSDNSIDLTVTSPPYDDLRKYEGYSFDFESVAKELYRVTKGGGVVVWVVGDQTINGSESGNSFRQALYFLSLGFNLHDTMIYEKNSMSMPDSNRYYQKFEYMFVFSKGKPKNVNRIKDHKNTAKRWSKTFNTTNNDGSKNKRERNLEKDEYGIRFNIWKYNTGFSQTTRDKITHPAPFPEKLAEDHIISWSDEGQTVLDPFMGSGTTAKAAIKLGREFIGFEISKKYWEDSENRIKHLMEQQKLF